VSPPYGGCQRALTAAIFVARHRLIASLRLHFAEQFTWFSAR
jgi:hypothetical protein